MPEQTIARNALLRAACKCISVIIATTALLVGVIGRFESVNMLWAVAPVICLWLLDTGYASADLRVLIPSESDKEESADDSVLRGSAPARFIQAIGSLSVWPFYVVLFVLVFTGAKALPKPSVGFPTQFPGTAAPSSYRQPATNPAIRTNPPRAIQPPLNGPGSAARQVAPPPSRPAMPAGVPPTIQQSPVAPPPVAAPAPLNQ